MPEGEGGRFFEATCLALASMFFMPKGAMEEYLFTCSVCSVGRYYCNLNEPIQIRV